MEIYMMNNREPFNKMETLHGEFYENALKYPERIALIYENEKVSYKMLRLYALRAANYMWQRGVRKNDNNEAYGRKFFPFTRRFNRFRFCKRANSDF